MIKCLMIFISVSCLRLTPSQLDVGECVLGENMMIWKLQRKESGIYLFVETPETNGAAIRTVEDISAFKKVACPE